MTEIVNRLHFNRNSVTEAFLVIACRPNGVEDLEKMELGFMRFLCLYK